jgi:indole-3-glycerol phosphate synthase
MPTTLEQIVAATRARVQQHKSAASRTGLQAQAAAHQPRGFRAALLRQAGSGPAVIAELKKASPSKGLIRENFDPPALAREYASAGATALSVLAEPQFFLGSLENLRAASEAAPLPCLCKDFIVDEFQLLEARAYGADAVLLLASVLALGELARLLGCARTLELDVLCEVHNAAELAAAVAAGSDLIGVNSRDLHTFQVDLETAIRLAPTVPAGVLKVAESGIHTAADLQRLRRAGYGAFLVGEAMMRAASPGQALRELLAAASAAEAVEAS